jgi:hypothetical protein
VPPSVTATKADATAIGYHVAVKLENFEQALRDFRGQQPFRPFYIELNNGSVVYVQHPEAVVSYNGHCAHIATDYAFRIFDHESVSNLSYEGKPKEKAVG